MSTSILPETLRSTIADFTLLDVLRPPARAMSGETIPGSVWRSPKEPETWWREFAGRQVLVFCVHGHEVSQTVRAVLADHGVNAVYLDGGFEAWKAAGLPVEAIAA